MDKNNYVVIPKKNNLTTEKGFSKNNKGVFLRGALFTGFVSTALVFGGVVHASGEKIYKTTLSPILKDPNVAYTRGTKRSTFVLGTTEASQMVKQENKHGRKLTGRVRHVQQHSGSIRIGDEQIINDRVIVSSPFTSERKLTGKITRG